MNTVSCYKCIRLDIYIYDSTNNILAILNWLSMFIYVLEIFNAEVLFREDCTAGILTLWYFTQINQYVLNR